MKPKKRKRWVLVLLCYGAAVLLYLGLCGLTLGMDQMHRRDGKLVERTLDFNSFFAQSMLLREGPEGTEDLVSTDGDPRLIYSPGEAFYASRFTFRAGTMNRPGGEMVLYYETKPGEGYSEAKRLSAKQAPDGSWYFDLPFFALASLRFDPATTGGVLWRDWQVVLNEPKPAYQYFVPDARAVFLLLFVPGFAAACIAEVGNIWRDSVLSRKAREKP